MHDRLTPRLSAHGVASFTEYYELIRRDPTERQQGIDMRTTNETYFFPAKAFEHGPGSRTETIRRTFRVRPGKDAVISDSALRRVFSRKFF